MNIISLLQVDFASTAFRVRFNDLQPDRTDPQENSPLPYSGLRGYLAHKKQHLPLGPP